MQEELWTAEQFALRKFHLPDGGRWTELVRGVPFTYSPPDDAHGTVVLNVSKQLAEFAHQVHGGYACFELGLILARDPDTVRCPPISYFTTGDRFAESTRDITSTMPTLVIEIASTNDRRQQIADRVEAYLARGIPSVWVLDTADKSVYLFEHGYPQRHYTGRQEFSGSGDLSAFQSIVATLFEEPSWWQASRRNGH